jgi:hypothetical protein
MFYSVIASPRHETYKQRPIEALGSSELLPRSTQKVWSGHASLDLAVHHLRWLGFVVAPNGRHGSSYWINGDYGEVELTEAMMIKPDEQFMLRKKENNQRMKP